MIIHVPEDRTVTCACDEPECEAMLTLYASDVDEFIEVARSYKWDVNNTFDLCPEHKDEFLPEKKEKRK